MKADDLELAPGTIRENLQGSLWQSADPEVLRVALEKAFDYRGDVTITRKDGSTVEGYIFDRRDGGSLDDSYVRLFPKDMPDKDLGALFGYRRTRFYGSRYRSRKELGSLGEEVPREEGCWRNKH